MDRFRGRAAATAALEPKEIQDRQTGLPEVKEYRYNPKRPPKAEQPYLGRWPEETENLSAQLSDSHELLKEQNSIAMPPRPETETETEIEISSPNLISPQALEEVLAHRDRAIGARVSLRNERANFSRQKSLVFERSQKFIDALRQTSSEPALKPLGHLSAESWTNLCQQLLHSLEIFTELEKKTNRADKKLERLENKLWDAESCLYDHLRYPNRLAAALPSSSSSAVESRATDFEAISTNEPSPDNSAPLLGRYYRSLIDFNLSRQRLLNFDASHRQMVPSPPGTDNGAEVWDLQQDELTDQQFQEEKIRLHRELLAARDELFRIRDMCIHDGIDVVDPNLQGLGLDMDAAYPLQDLGYSPAVPVATGVASPPLDATRNADRTTRVTGWLSGIDGSQSFLALT